MGHVLMGFTGSCLVYFSGCHGLHIYQPFLESARRVHRSVGRHYVCYGARELGGRDNMDSFSKPRRENHDRRITRLES